MKGKPKRKLWKGQPASSRCMQDNHHLCSGVRYSFTGAISKGGAGLMQCDCPCHPWSSWVNHKSGQNVV